MSVVGLGIAAFVVYKVLMPSESKSAEMLEIDGVATRPLPFADMAMTNAQERTVANVELNHLYGGVPDPSESGLIDYIIGTPSFLQGAI
tara:strand:+ start:30747 stop:31013 length:267 start_codon:yes stop_codon:yes gene_type:complete